MAQQIINLGTSANAGDGDNLRSAMDKTNDNFTEVYTAGPVGSNITISNNSITSTNTNGNISLATDGTGVIQFTNNFIPDTNDLRYIGSANNRPRGIYVGTAGLIADGPVNMPTFANATVRDSTITAPATGMIVVTGNVYQGYIGSAWTALAGSNGISAVADDTSPQLGGDLDLNSKNITGTGNIPAANLTGTLPALDGSALTNLTIPAQTFASLTSKPTTIAGYGITDALALGTSSTTALAGDTALFDGAFASLTGTPTTIAGYGITDALALGTSSTTALAGDTALFSGDYDDLSNKPTIPTAYTDSDVDTHLNTGSAGSNEVLSWDGADYAWVAQGGSGSGLQSRGGVTGTTSSLADAAQADLDITGFKSYALLTITTDRAARVRLYVSAATRTADASRAEGVDPTSDAGLIAEVITTGAETVIISPGAYGFNLESSPTTNIPCRVTNKSGSTSTVQVSLNILQLEA